MGLLGRSVPSELSGAEIDQAARVQQCRSCGAHEPYFSNVLPALAYVLCIVGANWAISTFGVVPVGFGFLAPAGVYFAGLTFTFRNLTQQTLGRRWGFGAIVVGAALSYAITDKTIPGAVLPLSVASGVSFVLSETADALVWTKLRERDWWARAMGLGDLAGQIIDSASTDVRLTLLMKVRRQHLGPYELDKRRALPHPIQMSLCTNAGRS